MPQIHHELLIGASTHAVYSAITTSEGLSAWWTPGAKATEEAGSIAHFPFGVVYFKEMKVLELIQHQKVVWTCTSGAAEWIGTNISFDLKAANEHALLQSQPELAGQMQQQSSADELTLLAFRHNGWKDYTPMFAECRYTWALFLRSLKLFCETGKGKPYPQQHSI